MVIGMAAAGAAALGIVGYLALRETPSASSAGTSQDAAPAAQATSGPSAAVSNPAKGQQQAQQRMEQQAQQAEEADLENLARGRGRSLAEMAADDEVDDTELISRFVLNTEGDRVGETMTITDGEVILKREDGFYSVAPDAIIEKNGTLLADANIDWDAAREAGQAWEDENLDRMEYDETGMPQQG